MWLVLALSSAALAGAVSVIIKYGLGQMSPDISLFIRTLAVLLFTLCFTKFKMPGLWDLVFIILSGVAMGLSWLCYYRALEKGSAGMVACVEKLSTPVTIVGGALILHESFGPAKLLSVLLIILGIFVMQEKREISAVNSKEKDGAQGREVKKERGWLFFALGCAFFTAASVLLSKSGLKNTDSALSLFLRTCVVLLISFFVALFKGEFKGLKKVPARTFVIVVLSGFVSGFSWLCYFNALKLKDAGVVQSIDRLGVLVTVGLSALIFKEKVRRRQCIGLLLLTAGILFPVIA